MRIRDSIAFVTGANRTRQFKARLSDDVAYTPMSIHDALAPKAK
jgi:hypothetical protein